MFPAMKSINSPSPGKPTEHSPETNQNAPPKNKACWSKLSNSQLSLIEKNLLQKYQQQRLLEYLNQDPVTGEIRRIPIEGRTITDTPRYWQVETLFNTPATSDNDAPKAYALLPVPNPPTYWYERNEKIIECIRQGADLAKVSLAGELFTGENIQERLNLISKHFTAFENTMRRASESAPDVDIYRIQCFLFHQTFSEHYLPPLHTAIKNNDEPLVQAIIGQNPQNIALRDFINQTPLLFALDQDKIKLKIIKHLINNGEESNNAPMFSWKLSSDKASFSEEYDYSAIPLKTCIEAALTSESERELNLWKKMIKLFFNNDVRGYQSANGAFRSIDSVVRDDFLPYLSDLENLPPENRNNATLEFGELGEISWHNFNTVLDLLQKASSP